MITLVWNVRGARKEVAVGRIKEMVSQYKFNMIMLLEPKIQPE